MVLDYDKLILYTGYDAERATGPIMTPATNAEEGLETHCSLLTSETFR